MAEVGGNYLLVSEQLGCLAEGNYLLVSEQLVCVAVAKGNYLPIFKPVIYPDMGPVLSSTGYEKGKGQGSRH